MGKKFRCTNGRCHQVKQPDDQENRVNKSRKTCTICPIEPAHRCNWFIIINYDSAIGSFIVSKCSGRTHMYHIRRSPEGISTTKFFSEDEIAQVKLQQQCHVPTTATRRVMFHQMGIMLDRNKLRFLKESTEGKGSVCLTAGHLGKTPAEKILSHLDSMCDVYYVALIDDAESGLYAIRSKGRPSKREALDLPDVDNYTSYLGKSLQNNDSKKLLLEIALTTKDAIQYSAAFPERLIVDTTYKSNIEKRALLIGTGITSCNSTFIALQAYLPCERAWVFQWLFRDVIPSLLGDQFVSRNCLLATDRVTGIYETFLQLKEQGKLYQNSDHMLCEFHLVNQHMATYVSSIPKDVKSCWQIAKDWIYSWITYCETEAVYMCS